jgi:hypothetical protein
MNAEKEDYVSAMYMRPSDDELLRRKHVNQTMARIIQEDTKKTKEPEEAEPEHGMEGCVFHHGRWRKERFFDQYGDEI